MSTFSFANNKSLNIGLFKIFKLLIKIVRKILRIFGIITCWNFIIQLLLFSFIKPDILYINNGGYPAAESCRVAVFSGKIAGIKKIFFHVNNLTIHHKNSWDSFKDKLINRYVTAFLTASKESRRRLIEYRGMEGSKVRQIYNFTRDQSIIKNKKDILFEFNISNEKMIIVQTGLLCETKGQIYLLKAINEINKLDKEVFNNIQVFLVGGNEDGSYLEKLREFICINDLKEKVIFTGYRDDYYSFINACDIFVFPSINNEDMPIVILNAMRLKKTIISTNLAGIPEQIDNGVEGILLDINDMAKLASILIQLYSDKSLKVYLAENAYKKYQSHFEYFAMIKEYYKLFA
jgi:glycosyltransferase involved in cell wall biosynthesis